MNERLRPLERIRKKRDFIFLHRNGRRLKKKYFTLVYRMSPLDFSRMAVVVSRRVGNAVIRNRVRRRMREIFRRNKKALSRPLDFLIIAHKEIQDASPSELLAQYLDAVGQACQPDRR